ncbi:MAG: PAS domain S-box protein [Pseudomonadota bacterium]
MREFRLRTWLMLLMTTAIILTFSIVGAAILTYRLPQIEEQGRTQAHSSAKRMARLTEQFLGGVEEQLLPLTELLANRLPQDIQSYLNAIAGEGNIFDAISVIDIDGHVKAVGLPLGRRAAAGDLLNADLSANRLFISARNISSHAANSIGVVWSDKYLSPLAGEMTVGLALHAGRHTIIGELSRHRLLAMLQGFGREGNAHVTIVDNRGQWLASTNPEPVMAHHNFSNLASFQAIVAGSALPSYEILGGKKVLPGGAYSTKLGWVFGSAAPAGWDHPNYRVTILLVLLGLIASIAITMMLAPFWAMQMEKPIRQMIEYAHKIAAFDNPDITPRHGNVTELNQLGNDLGIMGRAIREREEGMRRSEERLRATLEQTPSVAVQWYDRHGRILFWNHASEYLYGYTAAEAIDTVVSKTPLIYLDRQQANAFVGLLSEIERSGRPSEPGEYLLRRKDGALVTVLASTFAIPSDAGEPVFVCMDVDITKRKEAEAALIENEKKLLAIFNASPAPMSVSNVNDAYRLVDANAAWSRQFQRDVDKVRGKNGSEMGLWAEDMDRQRFLSQVEEAGRTDNFEAWLVSGDGSHLLCTISALEVNIGSQRLMLMMAVDITEQRRIENEIRQLNTELEDRVVRRTEDLAQAKDELEAMVENLKATQAQLVQSEKLAALGNLVAGVAHELNTPIGNALMAITTLNDQLAGFRSSLSTGIRRSDFDSFLGTVDTAGDIGVRNLQRAADLITSFKQVAIDQTSAQRRRFQLADLVHEIKVTLQPTLKRTPYVIESEVPTGLEFDSYPGPLGQVLANLINNAILHGFAGRDHGTIRITAAVAPHDQISLTVADDGRGIPEDLQRRVFDPFFTTRLGQGGSGLGLHIVFNAVTGPLGGSVSLDSHEGVGTTFVMLLPRKAPLSHVI